MSKTIYDEHTHLRPHTPQPPAHALQPMVAAAKQNNFELGIREHAPLPAKYRLGPRGDYYYAMALDEIEPFLAQFDGTAFALGLEVDYLADSEAETKQIVEDLLARARSRGIAIGGLHGSVHLLPGDFADIPDDKHGLQMVMWDDGEKNYRNLLESRGVQRAIEDYHAALLGLVQMEYFDVIGHIELLRKFDRRDDSGRSLYFDGYEAQLEEAIFDVIAKAAVHGIAVELNTQGMDKIYGRPFLSPRALKYCVDKNVIVTFGSDAHRPEEIGRYFEAAGKMFVEAGVERLAYFRERKVHFYEYR